MSLFKQLCIYITAAAIFARQSRFLSQKFSLWNKLREKTQQKRYKQ